MTEPIKIDTPASIRGFTSGGKGGYPEHEKLAKVSTLSNQLGEFIDWMEGEGWLFAEWVESEYRGGDAQLTPVHKTINEWLALFYGVDLQKIEDEKEQMLEEIRALNRAREEATDG